MRTVRRPPETTVTNFIRSWVVVQFVSIRVASRVRRSICNGLWTVTLFELQPPISNTITTSSHCNCTLIFLVRNVWSNIGHFLVPGCFLPTAIVYTALNRRLMFCFNQVSITVVIQLFNTTCIFCVTWYFANFAYQLTYFHAWTVVTISIEIITYGNSRNDRIATNNMRGDNVRVGVFVHIFAPIRCRQYFRYDTRGLLVKRGLNWSARGREFSVANRVPTRIATSFIGGREVVADCCRVVPTRRHNREVGVQGGSFFLSLLLKQEKKQLAFET